MKTESNNTIPELTLSECKLCLKNVNDTGRLCESHIIPRFILLKSKEKGRALCLDKEKDHPYITQKDWKEKMLCGGCEHKLKIFYEDFIHNTLFFTRKMPLLDDGKRKLLLSADNDRLALALLSIYWRAVVSTISEFRAAFAPEYVVSDLRDWIYNNQIPANWDDLVTVKIFQLKDSLDVTMNILVRPFLRNKTINNRFEFVFIFGGYLVSFKIPTDKNDGASKRSALKSKSKIVRIPKVDYKTVPEINEILEKFSK